MDLEKLFPRILKPALGCTEPVAVGLAVAAAVRAAAGGGPGGKTAYVPPAGERLKAIRVRVNRNVFKNAFSILIPNAEGHKGIVMAAALGALCDPALDLQLFRALGHEHITSALHLMDEDRVKVDLAENVDTDLFIEAAVSLALDDGVHEGECLIRDRHSNIVRLARDGSETFRRDTPGETAEPEEDPGFAELYALRFADIPPLARNLPESVRDLLRRTIELNTVACEAGLAQPLGLGAGFFGLSAGEGDRHTPDVASLTAAGSDARMSGFPVEVMSSAGSGNQGIIATVPVAAFARAHGLPENTLLEAVALSHLVTMHLALHVGYLSALCGVAVKAGIGAACGLVRLMGGTVEDMERAVKIMVATLSGMICDGAKAGCALKVSSSADMALRSAQLALRKMEVPDDNGIVAPTADETIRNLAALGKSMETADDKILAIMQSKLQ